MHILNFVGKSSDFPIYDITEVNSLFQIKKEASKLDQSSEQHDKSYSKTPIYRASRGKGFRPDKSRGPVNRIVKYTNLHTNPVFGGRGKVPVNRGTR